MIHLAKTRDNRLVLACSEEFPSDIARVEYYRDLKLFMLAFEGEDHEERLLPHELSNDIAQIVKQNPDIIVAIKVEGVEPYGYITPLVQIGL